MAKRWVDLDNWRHRPRKSDAAPTTGVQSVYRARVATIRASIEATEARLRNPSIEPEDIVGPLLFLASDLSNFVDGQTLVVDGGFTGN